MISRLKAIGLAAGLALGFGVAIPASAAPVVIDDPTIIIGARFIHITNPEGNWIQVAEVQALRTGDLANVALSTAGGQAASNGNSSYDTNNTADKAIDGFAPASYDHGDHANAGIFHSAGMGSDQYLDIILPAPTNLKSLTIYGRAECCQSRDIYSIEILKDLTPDGVLWTGILDLKESDTDAPTIGHGTINFAVRETAPVPEPASLALLGAGLFGLAAVRRRKQAA